MLVCVCVMQKYAIDDCVRVCDAEICNRLPGPIMRICCHDSPPLDKHEPPPAPTARGGRPQLCAHHHDGAPVHCVRRHQLSFLVYKVLVPGR